MRPQLQFFLLILTLGISLSDVNAQNDSIAPIATQPLVRGIYMNHSEFISNEPSVVKEFQLEKIARNQENWEGTYNLIPRFASNNRKVKRAWGFCDGEKTYINHEGEYFPIKLLVTKCIMMDME